MAIQWPFIARQEGGDVLTGYVPAAKTSQSGVTIASGFDLGQIHIGDLDALPLNPAIKVKLAPYVGLKRQDAIAALASQPLTISADDAEANDAVVDSQHGAETAQHYQAWGGNWAALEDAAQTVIADVAFQYGVDLENAVPHFWQQALACDWAGMYANLMDFGDVYPNRRRAEAVLIKPLCAKDALGILASGAAS
jgi:hypothetical protein